MDWIVTSGRTQSSTTAAQEACRFLWKIEPWYREGKQLNVANAVLRVFRAIIPPVFSSFNLSSG
jgi:hypothetical protein